MTDKDFATLCICAIRYCFGRKTYMPSTVHEIVIANFNHISDMDLNIIKHDLDLMRDWDFGDPEIDKPGWLNFRDEIQLEINRRKSIEKSRREIGSLFPSRFGEWTYFDLDSDGFLINCPGEEMDIIVLHRDGSRGTDTFCEDDPGEFYLDSGDEMITDVVAWMPYPDAPKDMNHGSH